MIENSLRAESSAVAFAADMRFRRRSPSEIARTASQAVFVAATAVLFVAVGRVFALTPIGASTSLLPNIRP